MKNLILMSVFAILSFAIPSSLFAQAPVAGGGATTCSANCFFSSCTANCPTGNAYCSCDWGCAECYCGTSKAVGRNIGINMVNINQFTVYLNSLPNSVDFVNVVAAIGQFFPSMPELQYDIVKANFVLAINNLTPSNQEIIALYIDTHSGE